MSARNVKGRAWHGGPLLIGSPAEVLERVEVERATCVIDIAELLKARLPVAEVYEVLECDERKTA